MRTPGAAHKGARAFVGGLGKARSSLPRIGGRLCSSRGPPMSKKQPPRHPDQNRAATATPMPHRRSTVSINAIDTAVQSSPAMTATSIHRGRCGLEVSDRGPPPRRSARQGHPCGAAWLATFPCALRSRPHETRPCTNALHDPRRMAGSLLKTFDTQRIVTCKATCWIRRTHHLGGAIPMSAMGRPPTSLVGVAQPGLGRAWRGLA